MTTAAEFMKKAFFHASPDDSVAVLLQEMAERGMGCVPVLDRARRPIGVATAGEIARHYDMNGLIERLDRPAVCLDQNTPIEVAARALVRQPSCCVILVDGAGGAVGALSPLELLAAVLGCESGSEAATRHEREAAWASSDLLELGAAHRAPDGPGIILLSPGLDERERRVVWAEPATNMRERLDQMLREPQEEEGLESMLDVYPRTVRFRCLTIQDKAQRERLADAMCTVERHFARPSHAPLPPSHEGAHRDVAP